MGFQNEGIFVEVLEHLLEGDRIVREEGEDVLTREGLCAFCYFDFVGEDGGSDQDGFVHVEFGAVGAAFGTELDDEDGCCEVAGVGGGVCQMGGGG